MTNHRGFPRLSIIVYPIGAGCAVEYRADSCNINSIQNAEIVSAFMADDFLLFYSGIVDRLGGSMDIDPWSIRWPGSVN
ncbi:hypothetical protein [Nocardia farcinica]|uniref:hypothetical protein n=1 Tax=Nocardia farcinica TaxID=37329 RepID=UPI002454A468|nr:hypothetical protein [Nocardia farcinica]